jgi:uncharacterized protein
MIDLHSKYLDEIKRILKGYVPGIEVRVFGSRVDGSARKYSDVDLVLLGKNKIDIHILEALKDAFFESGLPMQVDVLDWNSMSENFQKIAEKRYEIIQSAYDCDSF